jgi:hypothetical protein
MSDPFRIIVPMVRAEGKDVPPEQIQLMGNSIGAQTTASLNTLANGAGAPFAAAMLAWFNSLPTSLPGSPGVLWNNGGTLAQS